MSSVKAAIQKALENENDASNYFDELNAALTDLRIAFISDFTYHHYDLFHTFVTRVIDLLKTPSPHVKTLTKLFLNHQCTNLQSLWEEATQTANLANLPSEARDQELIKIGTQIHQTALLISNHIDKLAEAKAAETAKQFQSSLQEQLRDVSNRNLEMQIEIDSLSEQNSMLKQSLTSMEASHKTEIEKLQTRLSKEFKDSLKENTTSFVIEALEALDATKNNYAKIGVAWSLAALVAFGLGIYFTFEFATLGGKELVANKDMQWSLLAFYSVKGAIFLGLLIAIVRYCASQGRNYMHESLKSAERKHAINYGKFYLSAFGAGSDNENVKEAFAHWNISTTSAFLSDMVQRDEATHSLQFAETMATKIVDKLPSVKG